MVDNREGVANMHNSSILRMEWFYDNYISKINKENIRILDVGSYNVNGTYKDIFKDKRYEYYGLDMEKGPNVDIVVNNPYNWKEIESEQFDVVISGQAFEHIEFFWITIQEMTRVLKKDGLICLIAPLGFEEHRYPVDCYRFFTDGMIAIAKYVSLDILHVHTNCGPLRNSKGWYSKKDADSFLIAQKSYDGEIKLVDLETYVCIPEKHSRFRGELVPYNQRNIVIKCINRIIKVIKKLIKR